MRIVHCSCGDRKAGIDEDKAVCIKLLLESGKAPISYLDLTANSLNDRAVELILNGAKASPRSRLEVLLLDDNSLSPQTGMRLAQQFTTMGRRLEPMNGSLHAPAIALQILSLPQNKVGNVATEAIARALEKSASQNVLEYLDLSHNEIGDIGLSALASTIAGPRLKLHTLIALGNRFFDEGVKSMTKSLGNAKNTRLTNMKLGMLECGEEAFIDLVTEGVMRCKSLLYVYVTGPFSTHVVLERVNDSFIYKKVVCTEVLDADYYNKNMLNAICDAMEQSKSQNEAAAAGDKKPGTDAIGKYFVDKILAKAYGRNGLEILIYAVSQGFISPSKILHDGMAISHFLAQNNDIDGVNYMLKSGVSALLPTSIGCKAFPYCTIMHIVAHFGHIELLQRLISAAQPSEREAMLTALDMHGNTALHYAAREGRVNVCATICQAAAECLVMKNRFLDLPFHAAIIKDMKECFVYLSGLTKEAMEATTLKEMWDNTRGSGGAPAICLAAKYGSHKIMDCLLDSRVHVCLQDDRLRTPLHWALEVKGNESMAMQLVAANKEVVNVEDENGETPVFYAVRRGLYEILIELDKAGADLHHANKSKATLLHCAAKAERADIIGYLIEKGLSPLARNRDQQFPKDLAAKPHIRQMLSLKLEQEHTVESGSDFHVLPPMNTSENASNGETFTEMLKYAYPDSSIYPSDVYQQLPRKKAPSTRTVSALNAYQGGLTEEKQLAAKTIAGVFNYRRGQLEVPQRMTQTEASSTLRDIQSEVARRLNTVSQADSPAAEG